MKNERIKAVLKRPGELPHIVHIGNNLKVLQDLVGGYIETVTLASDLVIICNEEGRLLGLEPNCTVCGVSFVGNIIIAAYDDEGNFTDVKLSRDELMLLFPNLYGGVKK